MRPPNWIHSVGTEFSGFLHENQREPVEEKAIYLDIELCPEVNLL